LVAPAEASVAKSILLSCSVSSDWVFWRKAGDANERRTRLMKSITVAQRAGFCRTAGLERRFHDIQAARYHPLQAGLQARYAGLLALSPPVDRIF
jgi:hypothetical protein